VPPVPGGADFDLIAGIKFGNNSKQVVAEQS